MNARERLAHAIAGEPVDQVAVAPAYLSLYLDDLIQKHYLKAYERKSAGTEVCAIDHAEDSRFRAEAILAAYQVFQEQPDWIHTEPGESRAWAEHGIIRRGPDEAGVQPGIRWTYVDTTSGEIANMGAAGQPMQPNATRFAYRVRSSRADVWDETTGLRTEADVDALAPIQPAGELEAQGVFEVTRILAQTVGDRVPLCYIAPSPFWSTYGLLGFRGMMLMIHENPRLFAYLMERRHQQRLEVLRGLARAGLRYVWVEECLSSADLISPRHYEAFAFPAARQFIRDAKGLGLTVVFYYCGDVISRLPWLKRLGMDALAVEESKKGFSVEIGDVIRGVGGACCVFGNVDAIQVMHAGTEEVIEAEVQRQIRCGRRARGFVLCQGSPFTLDTPPAKIDWFVRSARRASL